jgi:hypothetical protein
MDSHAPQTEYLYHYDNDDWGEQHENEYEDQWDTEEEFAQTGEDVYEAYPTEVNYDEGHYEVNDQEANQEHEDDLDEDDQDNYE